MAGDLTPGAKASSEPNVQKALFQGSNTGLPGKMAAKNGIHITSGT